MLGVLFVLFVIFVPEGLVSIPALLEDRFARQPGGEAAAVGEPDPETEVGD